MPISFEILGEIVIINKFSDGDDLYAFSEMMLKKYKKVRTVVTQISKVEGKERTRKFKVIIGDNNLETLYKEYGLRFYLDPSKVFFSPRLKFERQRIANSTKNGEIVLNLFAGVGPFSIAIAKKNPLSLIYSIEVNPFAYRYLIKNIQVNKCNNNVIAYFGDAFILGKSLFKNKVNRVLTPLPMVSDKILPVACDALYKGKGTIHWEISSYVKKNKSERNLIQIAEKQLEKATINCHEKYNIQISSSRIIRTLSPNISHIAVDLDVTPNI